MNDEMNDAMQDFERELQRHGWAGPGAGLRVRIVALPGRQRRLGWWPDLAAAVLAVAALVEIVATTGRVLPVPQAGDGPEATVATLRQLELPLNDQETRLLAAQLDAGSRLKLVPEIHGKGEIGISLGGLP